MHVFGPKIGPKTHILFIVDYYAPRCGGAEKLFSQLTHSLLKKECYITIITSKHDTTLPSYTKNKKLTILRTGRSRYTLWRYGLRSGLKFFVYKYQRNNPVTLIHTTSYCAAVPAWVLAKLFSIPLTITIHELFGTLWKKVRPWTYWPYMRYENLLTRLGYDAIVVVSEFTKKQIKTYNPKINTPIHRIYNGIDQSFYTLGSPTQPKQNKQNQSFTALYYGHCGFSKGVDTYINALPVLYKNYPQTNFWFNLLDSKYTPNTIKQLKKLQKTLPITITRTVSEAKLHELITKAGLIVLPSRSEGFGLAIAEASASSTPLITTSAGAIPEVVHGRVYILPDTDNNAYLNAWHTCHKKEFQYIPKKIFSRETTLRKYHNLRERYSQK